MTGVPAIYLVEHPWSGQPSQNICNPPGIHFLGILLDYNSDVRYAEMRATFIFLSEPIPRCSIPVASEWPEVLPMNSTSSGLSNEPKIIIVELFVSILSTSKAQ